MPGVFSKSARPLRPGAYFNWIATVPNVVPPAVGSIVCVPFTSDWGPFKVPTLVGSFQEYISKFGPTVGTPGYIAVWQAFQGEGGFEGRYGAGAVLCYRMGGASAAKSSRVVQNTTPATALTLSARYEGVYGNGLTVTVQDNILDASQDQVIISLGAQVLETYSYTDTDIAGLAAAINANSSWVTAVANVTGTKLGYVSNSAFSGGNDGSTTIGSDWTALQAALETQQFGILAPYGLTDGPTISALKAWAGGLPAVSNGRNSKGQRFEVVVGGIADEAASVAVASAATLNDGNFCRIGMSHVVDQVLLDANNNPVTLSSAQLVPRVAGALAQRGEAMSLTSVRFPGLVLYAGPTEADITATLNGGVMVLSQDSDPDAPVHIEAARTTFTSGGPSGAAANAAYPYLIYRNPKFMRTMQNIEVEWTAWANRVLIGKLPVSAKTRDAAIAELQGRLRAREDAGIIQPGWSVAVDQNPPPTELDEFIALVVGLKFGRSVEQVYFTVNVG